MTHVALALLLASSAGGDSLGRYEFVEQHMGTLFRIVVYAPTAGAAQAGADAAFARVSELNAVFSDYDSTSEIRRMVRQPARAPVPVSEELFTLLARANELAIATEGAFDVTVGPAVQLWRRARRTGTLPSESERNAALERVGYRKLVLDSARRMVTLMVAGMQLDFGGIAKGAAADAALGELRRRGLERAMVAAGGDIAIGEPPAGSDGWTIDGAPAGRVYRNCGISTSGDANQYVEIGGVRYAHIVDPRTGLGVVGGRQVTIVAASATESDALATAAFVRSAMR